MKIFDGRPERLVNTFQLQVFRYKILFSKEMGKIKEDMKVKQALKEAEEKKRGMASQNVRF